jgi:hypothetical protein
MSKHSSAVIKKMFERLSSNSNKYTGYSSSHFVIDGIMLNKSQQADIIKIVEADTQHIDIRALREKFFKECVGEDLKVNMSAHNLFEWFKKEIQL